MFSKKTVFKKTANSLIVNIQYQVVMVLAIMFVSRDRCLWMAKNNIIRLGYYFKVTN